MLHNITESLNSVKGVRLFYDLDGKMVVKIHDRRICAIDLSKSCAEYIQCRLVGDSSNPLAVGDTPYMFKCTVESLKCALLDCANYDITKKLSVNLNTIKGGN